MGFCARRFSSGASPFLGPTMATLLLSASASDSPKAGARKRGDVMTRKFGPGPLAIAEELRDTIASLDLDEPGLALRKRAWRIGVS